MTVVEVGAVGTPAFEFSKGKAVALVAAAAAVAFWASNNGNIPSFGAPGAGGASAPSTGFHFGQVDRPPAAVQEPVLPCDVGTATQRDNQRVQAAVQRAAQRTIVETGLAPGATVAISCGDRLVATAAVGTTDGRHQTSANLSEYDQASETKLITTASIMMMAQDGILKLTDPVSKYLPKGINKYRHGAKSKVTFIQDLQHRSGMSDSGEDTVVGTAKTTRAVERNVLLQKLTNKPGQKYEYSNEGFSEASIAASYAAGVTIAQYQKTRIFTPLGMSHTGRAPHVANCPPTSPDPKYNNADMSKIVQCVPQDFLAWKLGDKAGHAGVFSTAEDMGKFIAMLANGGKSNGNEYLSPANMKLLSTQQKGLDTGYATGARTNKNYTFSSLMSPESFGHTGWNGGGMFADPKTGLSTGVNMNMTFKQAADPNSDKTYKAISAINDAVVTVVKPK